MKPLRPAEFHAAASATASLVNGLPLAIDAVADAAPPSHGFLRRAWFAAAVEAYGGRPRTLVVEEAGAPVLALPFVGVGPRVAGLARVPGSYWPFRGFPSVAGPEALGAGLASLSRAVRVLRIGPVPDGDPCVEPLLAAARADGWAVIDRAAGESWLFPLADACAGRGWPRASTLKKNRFHEKHLAAHGALGWQFVGGDDWPAAFDRLAAVEERSWIAARTDGRDAKFTVTGHGRFWRALARDPAMRPIMRAAVLDVGGEPAAFSFDLLSGDIAYAIANSYDPAYAKHSPGKLLQRRNLLDLAERGVETVDWGMGDSGYKQVIGAVAGPTLRDWFLVRPGLPALAARLWRQVRR